MKYTVGDLKRIYKDALDLQITDTYLKDIRELLYELTPMCEFSPNGYFYLISVLKKIKLGKDTDLTDFKDLYNSTYKDVEDLPKDHYICASMLSSVYTDYSKIKSKKDFKRISCEICFLFPCGNDDKSIELIEKINKPLGKVMKNSSTFFLNRPSNKSSVMYAYMMNTMFAEMIEVFLKNIEYYEYDYSLPSRVMMSLLKNGNDAIGVLEVYSKEKDIELFIKALFNVYKKENGVLFKKEEKGKRLKNTILPS